MTTENNASPPPAGSLAGARHSIASWPARLETAGRASAQPPAVLLLPQTATQCQNVPVMSINSTCQRIYNKPATLKQADLCFAVSFYQSKQTCPLMSASTKTSKCALELKSPSEFPSKKQLCLLSSASIRTSNSAPCVQLPLEQANLPFEFSFNQKKQIQPVRSIPINTSMSTLSVQLPPKQAKLPLKSKLKV
eukprot:488551-Pelagomonas_calceolata.AAC.5